MHMNIIYDSFQLMRSGHWREAHNLIQTDGSLMAAWLHGILHVQEGDLEDAEYWYGKSGRHFRSRGTLNEEVDAFEVEMKEIARKHISIESIGVL